VFFGLHRHEVLLKPQYSRLVIGKIKGEEPQIKALVPGETSKVPYAEPTWLADGFKSPYYKESHRKFQKKLRAFLMEHVQPEAEKCEANGKRISQEVVDKLAYGCLFIQHIY
jgi:nicotinamide riboside kinase